MSVPFDVRYGLRKLNNNTGFTMVAVACLALGICASVTVFSVANALLLRPVPGVERTDRIVSLAPKPGTFAGMPGALFTEPISYPVFLRYRDARHVFSELAAYHPFAANLVAGGEPLRLVGQVVTDNYFSTLGMRSALGRLFAPGERARERQLEVVLSHSLWQRAFGARQRVMGSTVHLNGRLFLVIGIAPPGFRGTLHGEEVDLWVPIETAPLVLPELRGGKFEDPTHGWLHWFFGRLAPGVDAERAQREMDLLAGRLAAGDPFRQEPPPGLQLYPGLGIRPGARGDLVSPLALLFAMVGLLMLVVCANLGGLLLVRAAARQEEIGIRLALGVTRGRLVRQLLTESLTLSLIGGAVGFLLAVWAVDALEGFSLGQYLPRMNDLSIDGRVVAFTLVLSLAAGAFFGLIPALWATRRQVTALLRPGMVAVGQDRGRHRLQEAFVVAQITVSLILLVITGLFVRTLWNLRSIDPGFDSRHVVNLRLDLSLQDYTPSAGSALYEQLLSQVRGLPPVRSASLALWVPLSRANKMSRLTSLRSAADGDPVESEYNVVAPAYFQTLGIPLLRGRDFTAADRPGSLPVLIVDETLANTLWPGGDPIGERLTLPRGEVREVVGVAGSVRLRDLQSDPQPYFYVPLAQRYESATALAVRTSGDPLEVVDSLRSIIRKLDPNLGVQVSLFGDEVRGALTQPRLFSWLFGSFSLVALLITAIGLYGTLAYAISRRTRELGIRMALGAQGSEIVGMVIRRGLILTLTGLILGLAAASWTTSVFSRLLFGVTPTDPGVFASVTLVLTLVGLAASSLPAYAATQVDPMAVIRHE
ncbi:MAG TPA: ABC transporter permease [Thermoanaerobaculia bacterium]|jgi:predicted permease